MLLQKMESETISSAADDVMRFNPSKCKSTAAYKDSCHPRTVPSAIARWR